MSGASSPKAVLAEHGLLPKRHFGQNFLADARLAARIAELCTPETGGSVLEIGAGLGALTAPLLERSARVIAVERDRDLVPVLRQLFSSALDDGRLELVEADAKTADWLGLLAAGPRPHVLSGNLPYQITGPLLERTVGMARVVERAVFLVQLEVAERMAAAPGSSNYGALSVFVQAAFAPERALIVRRGAFYPQPGVDSAVVVLSPRTVPLAVETGVFRSLVAAAFGKRRKTLRNAWHGVLGLEPTVVGEAAARAGIDLTWRGERLGAQDFGRMAFELGDREQPHAA
jgi:16S rRNA (adenine1518-N6/adenine1519-N6)-dimethyltransferase